MITYDNEHVSCHINLNPILEIVGQVKNPDKFIKIVVQAAAPIDRMTTYSGSGLPFPCRQIAFENTPNYHQVALPEGKIYVTSFDYPNSYYDASASIKIPPSIEILLYIASQEPIVLRIPLPDPLPLKTLTYRQNQNHSPVFYARREMMPITGQEEYLRSIASAKVALNTA